MEPISREETLKVNERQREFYNQAGKGKNLGTRIWSFFRNKLLSDFREEYQIKNRVYDQHKVWMGDLSAKKILDLGCLRGNALSLYMAKNAKSYTGIDLSEVAIEKLRKKLIKNNCDNAKAVAIDFYSPDFTERGFDIIYAYGVIHHFPDLDQLFNRFDEVMNPGGIIISYDPLETSLPLRILRKMYRPFQDDKDWEWPFDKKALNKISTHFHIDEMHGVLGKSKWGMLLNVLPMPDKRKIIDKKINADWNINTIGPDLYGCMQVTFCLRKK